MLPDESVVLRDQAAEALTHARGGVVYVLDDAVWLVEDGSTSGSMGAVTLEEMALLDARR